LIFRTKVMRIGIRLMSAVAASLVSGGCGAPADDLPREPVWGNVTIEGKPLAAGMIQFVAEGGNQAPQIGAMIEDGSYRLARLAGPVPGRYKILITASAGGDAPAPTDGPGGEEPPLTDLIPAQYNTASELTREIEPGKDNHFDFDLKSQPPQALKSPTKSPKKTRPRR
jgi:hypothetical protein